MNEILTIGYEGKSLADLISTLKLRGVTMLVDVRLNAISRKRGFSKTALREGLSEEGIAYVHSPELGNARDNRAGYAEIGTREGLAARSRFRETLQSESAVEALENVRKHARIGRVSLFCYEHDIENCHRQQVLEALTESASATVAAA